MTMPGFLKGTIVQSVNDLTGLLLKRDVSTGEQTPPCNYRKNQLRSEDHLNSLMSRKCGGQWGLGRLIAFYGEVMMFDVVFAQGRVLKKLKAHIDYGIFRNFDPF